MLCSCLSIFKNKRCDDDMRGTRFEILKSIIACYSSCRAEKMLISSLLISDLAFEKSLDRQIWNWKAWFGSILSATYMISLPPICSPFGNSLNAAIAASSHLGPSIITWPPLRPSEQYCLQQTVKLNSKRCCQKALNASFYCNISLITVSVEVVF